MTIVTLEFKLNISDYYMPTADRLMEGMRGTESVISINLNDLVRLLSLHNKKEAIGNG